MKIFLNDIQLHAKHGVLPQERLVGNDYLITVEADAHVEKAGVTDDLGDTVNYADMANAVRQEMPPYRPSACASPNSRPPSQGCNAAAPAWKSPFNTKHTFTKHNT